MDVATAVSRRHSVRVFDSRQVALELVKKIIFQAQRTPSWVDSQPWKVYLATGKSLQQIRRAHVANSATASGESDWPTWHRERWNIFPRTQMAHLTADREQYLSATEQTAWPEMQHQLYRAPVVLYLTIPKQSPNWSIFDLGAFAQTIMLLAQAEGLGSMVAYEFVRFPQELRDILTIPDDEAIAIGIGLGYEAKHHFNAYHSSRLPIDQVLKIND
ncbi:MAG: nitroreductase [Lactobacillus sp.]|nr:nitroreductase [Lactobacillus sp.]MDN6052006.1 nitroreductase [Lactobacillus sp.]